MSDLATISFNATVPTSFIKDFFDGLVTLENARSVRLERLLDGIGKTVATFFSPTVDSCCPVTTKPFEQTIDSDITKAMNDIFESFLGKKTPTETTPTETTPTETTPTETTPTETTPPTSQ